MGVIHGQDSEYAKEMRAWNAQHSEFGPPGRPYVYREYPTMMYRVGRNAQGQTAVLDKQVAETPMERENLESRGFLHGGVKVAWEAFEAHERELATLAAERHFELQRMSEGAQRDVAAVEAAAGMRHLGTIAEEPVRRGPGRPTNAERAARSKEQQ